mmetsp:Transcript_63469/g.147921  ORF Transcript_63469/g.147921 Transcript_63469/m.147921 type:complete len:810 (+) Transcript_63469:86-2515(+)
MDELKSTRETPAPKPPEKPSKALPAETTPLWRCLQEEDVAGIEVLVKQPHTPVNIRDSTFGWTPIHFVCNTGNVKLMKLLLEAKAKVGVGDNEGNTPLMLACRRGHVRAVEFLIGEQVPLDVQNNNGWTALIWSAINGHEDAATALMAANSNYLTTDSRGRSACMWAARHGHLGIVEAILANGINLGVEDYAGLTVMDHAQEHHEMRSMIAAVGELNDELLEAVKRNDEQEVCDLLQAGANINLRDEEGWTPLMWAVLQKSVDLVELIVRHGANPSLLDEKGDVVEALGTAHLQVGEALHTILGANDRMLEAAKAGDWDAVEEELKTGAFINVRDESKRTVFMWAGRNHACEAMTMLVARNALLDERDLFGWAAVHYAVESHNLVSVAMLWHLGADFTVRTSEDDSLLHIAVRGDDGPMIQLLLASNAKLEDWNVEKHTPLMVATTNSLTQSIHTLMAYKASVTAADDRKRTAFALAVVKGQLKAIQAMLEPRFPPKVVEGAGVGRAAGPKATRKTLGKASSRATSPKKGPLTAAMSDAKLTHRKQLAAAAGGVARRKKTAPAVTAEKRGDDTQALLQEAEDMRAGIVSKRIAQGGKALLRQVDMDHRAPLALAVVSANMQVFHKLLEESADPTASNVFGNTVLMEAVIVRQREAVQRLLELGVKIDVSNREGKTAKELCEDPVIGQMLDRYSIVQRLPETEPTEVVENQRQPSKVQRVFRVRMEQLPTQLTDQLLEQNIRMFLKQRGASTVIRIDVAVDPITSRPRGYAYLDFADAVSADLAVRGDGHKMNGHVVRVLKEASISLISN